MAGIFRGLRDQQDAFDLESDVLTNSSISSSLILHTSVAQFIVVYSLRPANMANNKMTSLVTFLLVALAVHTVAGKARRHNTAGELDAALALAHTLSLLANEIDTSSTHTVSVLDQR